MQNLRLINPAPVGDDGYCLAHHGYEDDVNDCTNEHEYDSNGNRTTVIVATSARALIADINRRLAEHRVGVES